MRLVHPLQEAIFAQLLRDIADVWLAIVSREHHTKRLAAHEERKQEYSTLMVKHRKKVRLAHFQP